MKDSCKHRRVLVAATLLAACINASASDTPTAKAAAKVDTTMSAADLSADATYVLPGAFKADMSLDDLRKRFGASHVKAEDIVGIEDSVPGIVLFGDDPLRRAEIFPQDQETLRGIGMVRITGNKSRWHLDNGFRLGITLKDLVAANGQPITFYGLAWDYGGIVTDWHGGRLEHLKDGPVHRSVALGYARGQKLGADAVPMGEGEYRSDDPNYPLQGKLVIVGELAVSFEQIDGK